ncbi:MAG: hypothetical protein K2G03_05665, partial [Bacilli bacterium]|nr:hypothetical protein [Bacilli bacterium]
MDKTFIKRQEIYDMYWYFAYERQEIFVKKLNGEMGPWTSDRILQEYKFCNPYRVNDRVSQYLLRRVIYNGNNYSDKDMLFRIILFKLFNKEATWELLEGKMGDIILEKFNINKFSEILNDALNNGISIYNDAYISCANKAFGYEKKHDNHLALLSKMFIEDHIDEEIINAKSMEAAYNM